MLTRRRCVFSGGEWGMGGRMGNPLFFWSAGHSFRMFHGRAISLPAFRRDCRVCSGTSMGRSPFLGSNQVQPRFNPSFIRNHSGNVPGAFREHFGENLGTIRGCSDKGGLAKSWGGTIHSGFHGLLHFRVPQASRKCVEHVLANGVFSFRS